jgi:hypothetical protein
MHPNFFHWHERCELKPDTSLLEPRWGAAVKFAEKLTSGDVHSLIRLILLPGVEPEFAKRFTESLVKSEPTFPIANNTELLRVMAAAAAHSRLEKPTDVADAIALGLQAASFPNGRVEAVCNDIISSGNNYLATESERMRPDIDAGSLEKSEKQVDAQFANLKKVADTNSVPETAKAFETAGRGVFGAMKESHERLSHVIGRLSEESQYLWWIVGRWSENLKSRREKLSAKAYSLPAAVEAADRVRLLPPAPSVESLIDEALGQCHERDGTAMPLTEIVQAADDAWAQTAAAGAVANELTPLATLLAERKQAGKPDGESLKRLGISGKVSAKATAGEVARQYFRELMFLRALRELD